MNTSQKIIKVGLWLEVLVDMSVYAINHKAKNRELAVHRLLSIQRIEDEIKKCSSFIEENYRKCRKNKDVAKMFYGDAICCYKWSIHRKAKELALKEVKKYYKEIETINDFIAKFGQWNYNADFTHLERKVIDGRFSFSWLDIEK
jgi:hypothetical protein